MPVVRLTCPGCRFSLQMDRTLPAQIACPRCRHRWVAERADAPAAPQAAPRPQAAPADAPWWENQPAARAVPPTPAPVQRTAPPPPPPPAITTSAPKANSSSRLTPDVPPAAPSADAPPVRWGLLAGVGGGF